jgi:cytochrome c oxidase subunit 3
MSHASSAIDGQVSGHGDGHGHAHSAEHAKYPFLAHHFETPAQQFDSAKFGMWLFLATEVLFFGALFVGYAVLRSRFPEVFSYASHYLDTVMGGINTGVLILSSLTMALGVYFAQRGKKLALIICLWLTMAGAAGFLVIKYFEYSHKIHAHLVWGPTFYIPPHDEANAAANLGQAPVAPTTAAAALAAAPIAGTPAVDASVIRPANAGPAGISPTAADHSLAATGDIIPHEMPEAHLADPAMPPNTHLFFAIYYAMTGLHGIHVVIGMVVIGMLIYRATRGDFGPNYYTPVDLVGLYWHIVDLVWIFLFPLFYLIH